MGIRIKDLYVSAVDVKPQYKDFSKDFEEWDYYEAEECWNCGKAIVTNHNPECPECGQEHDGLEGPMMNYFYALPHFDMDPEEAAKKLIGVSLCLVHRLDDVDEENEWGLALTGGGMDMSWDICEAYILLGYLPPLFACNLPDFAGKKLTTRAKLIIGACARSTRVAEGWAVSTRKRLRELRKTMRKRAFFIFFPVAQDLLK